MHHVCPLCKRPDDPGLVFEPAVEGKVQLREHLHADEFAGLTPNEGPGVGDGGDGPLLGLLRQDRDVHRRVAPVGGEFEFGDRYHRPVKARVLQPARDDLLNGTVE